MYSFSRYLIWLTALPAIALGCGLLIEEPVKKGPPLGLIATPPSYYSTPKARFLGEKYKGNLDRLVERIVRSSKTANLQFANNIASVGGIGFFTHTATRSQDERYLEVIVGAPETFQTKGDYSSKVHRLFSLYGTELLSILSSDSEIYQERDVTGYGLSFAWRNIAPQPSEPRVTMERAVSYFSKERVRGFLRREVSEDKLLGEAVIFAAEEEGPLNMVSYRPPDGRPDFRPPIQEENLLARKAAEEAELKSQPLVVSSSQPVDVTTDENRVEGLDKEQKTLKERPSLPAIQTRPQDGKDATKKTASTPETSSPVLTVPALAPVETARSAPTPDRQEVASLPVPVLTTPREQKPTERATPQKSEAPKAKDSSPDIRSTGHEKKTEAASSRPRVETGQTPRAPATLPAVEPRRQVEAAAPQPTMPIAKIETTGAPQIESPPLEQKKIQPVPVAPKVEVKAAEEALVTPRVVAGDRQEKITEKSPPGQIALLGTKPKELVMERKQLVRPAPKPLEGYIIQLSFAERAEAQRWAETLERRGYTVSVTEPGGGGSVRVRIGNFPARGDAERQLQRFRQDGLSGIVLNLPQAYRPQAQSPAAEGSEKPISAVQ